LYSNDTDGNIEVWTINVSGDRVAYYNLEVLALGYSFATFDTQVLNEFGLQLDPDTPMNENRPNDKRFSTTAPAEAKKVIAVGAVDRSGDIAWFSSRGPTTDGRVKPDVVAPGVNIWSTVPIDRDIYDGNRDGYTQMNGTSMAAPHVSGVAALLIQQYRELYGGDPTPAEIKALIMNSGLDQNENVKTTKDNTYGCGKVDAYRAYLSFIFSGNNGGIFGAETDEVTVWTPHILTDYLPVKGTLYWEDWDDQFEFRLDGINANIYDTTAIASNTNPESQETYTFTIHGTQFGGLLDFSERWYLATTYPPVGQIIEGTSVWGFANLPRKFSDDKIRTLFAIPVGVESFPQHGSIRVLVYLENGEEINMSLFDQNENLISQTDLSNVYVAQVFSNSNPDTGGWKLEIISKTGAQNISIMTSYPLSPLPTYLEINPIQMFAGPASSPTQIEFEVEVYNGNDLFHYAPYSSPSVDNFEVKVGDKEARVLAVQELTPSRYKLTVAPPAQPSDGKYDLLVNFTFEKFGVSNTASASFDDAVEYGAGKAVNVDIALVIDSSGSMSSNDPTDLRKAAAKYFVDFLSIGDWVAVVDFDEDVAVWKHLTNITNQAVKNEIKNAIDNIDSSGMTNIGGGLLYGYNELNSTQTGNRKAAILLTDGYHNTGTHPNQVVPKYKAKGWPIYTIALTGDADENLLKQIASETGGKYIKAEKAEDLLEIYNDLKKIVKKQSTLQKISKTISQGENITQDVMIDPSIRSFDVSVSWQGSDLDLYLYYPNGIQVELNASSPTGTNDPNITYISSSTYELYSVENPVPGRWSYEIIGKQVTGKEKFTATVAATTEIILSATTDKLEYYLNEPVIIMATFTNLTGGIENADVTANITKPDGFVENVRLADKGSGSYSTIYANTSLSGTYAVEVKANASGVIRIASLQFEVLSIPPQINISPKEIDFGLCYPGDTKSATFKIEYNSSGSVSALQSSAFTSLLKELESGEETPIIQGSSSKIRILQAGQSGGLTGVVIIGDFVGENGTIEATNVMISDPVISLPTAGKLNITLQLNLPYDIKEGNYTSTVQVITNVGTDIINLNLTVQALSKSAVVNQIEDDLNDWLRAQTEGEKAYYIERIADRLVYWRFVGGGKR